MTRRARACASHAARPATSASGQAAILLVGTLGGVLAGAFALAAIARGIDLRSEAQRAADLAAVAGGAGDAGPYPRLFDSGPAGMPKADYLAVGREAALRVARLNGAGRVRVEFPDGRSIAPVRIRVRVVERLTVRHREEAAATRIAATAEAELVPGAAVAAQATGGG